MKRQAGLTVVFCLFFASSVLADLLISKPLIARIRTDRVEPGASPEINIDYRNDTGDKRSVSDAVIGLKFDPRTIDQIIALIPRQEEALPVVDYDIDPEGTITCRLAGRGELVVPPGKSVTLATIVFHLTQSASPQASVALFDWAGANQVLGEGYDLTGKLAGPPGVGIEPSRPPEFTGLSQVVSANTLGQKDPGNTLVLDWRTPAGGFDRTRYYDNKLSFRVWRREESGAWRELAGDSNSHDPALDPYERIPYVGNTNTDYLYEDTGLDDGRTYYYKVTALDDTSPRPNEQESTVVLSGAPYDLTPPGEVSLARAIPGDWQVQLTWQNPPDPDLGGVVIMVKEDSPIGRGNLGSATRQGSGPECEPGQEPFGPGKGFIFYVSPQAANPADVPQEFIDDYAANGVKTYYRVFTYDRVVDGSPREFGRNYSRGVPLEVVPGIAPAPITDFKAEKGEFPGEMLLTWRNSPDSAAEGTVIRYSNDINTQFAALKNARSGELLSDFPRYGEPGDPDGYYVAGLPPDRHYYFAAFSRNATLQPFDPADRQSYDHHLFGQGAHSSYYIPPELTRGQTVSEEAEPAIKLWFGDRLYNPELVRQGMPFVIPAKPTIKMEVEIPEPYELDPYPSNYYLVLDGARTYAFQSYDIKARKATMTLALDQPLKPGKHLMTVAAKSAGKAAAATAAARTATVIVSGGEFRLLDTPYAFPNPFNPEKDRSIFFQYSLSEERDIELLILSLDGRIVRRILVSAGEEGSRAQLNKYVWDGITNQGQKIANGAYLLNIIDRKDGRPLGKVRFTVYR